MNRSARAGLVAAATAGIVLTASPASAGGGAPAGDGDGFVPVETVSPDYYASAEVEACGGTVTIAYGDVREVEVRETVLPDGTVVTEYRGDATVDLTRDDGAVIDELDISGPGRQVVSADGTQFEISLQGASILFPVLGPVDEAAFAAAGLPDLAWYRKGVVVISGTGNPETGELVTEEIDVHARVVDLCTWFDGGRGHRGQDAVGHHGHG